ncbi:MAG: TIGR03960 family B12-binding radical SAM protein [Dehalococcoidia bacterium]|nr:TIGR03960 family B12-binding radical SAM protein [Dehalococcoidia bacterium]
MTNLDDILYEVSKPARYSGGEWNSVIKDWQAIPIRIALAFPDVYEVGMSNLALPILYKILNDQPDALAERVYAPWVDMEALLRQHNIPLFSLETRHPLKDFDIIGFSLGYELIYTNVLNMLDLAKIPLFSHQRNDSQPLVIAGGSCALNPEPIADFIDLFVIGEAEETILKFFEVYRASKNNNKEQVLKQAAKLPGVYVPSLYEVFYHKDGTFASIKPKVPEARLPIERQLIDELPQPVTRPVVPHIKVVHDRGAVEIQRGCSRGCRFCQAGMIYRPVRELPEQQVIEGVAELISNCGYNEVSLVSLSTGDYHNISELIGQLSRKYYHDNLTLSVPSLRLDTSSIDLVESLPYRRKTTLTFAPEAGTERLRQVINKHIPEEAMLNTFAAAFEKGWLNLKLYFMVGLPTETIDDIKGIIELVTKTCQLGKKLRNKPPRIRVSVATFVPKPHTPCQWLAQDTEEQLNPKHEMLKQGLRRTGAHLSWQDTKISQLEAALSRGDRRLGKVIHKSWELGSKFDAWQECFNYDNWLRAFNECKLDPAFYANRERPTDEVLPWQHIDIGVNSAFLEKELHYMRQGKETSDCRHGHCNACGLQQRYLNCQQKFKQNAKLV